MSKPIKILQVVSGLSIDSGVMSVIMNYYKNINRDLVQFDFLYFEDKNSTYNEQINELGGQVFKLSKPSLKSLSEYKEFFLAHQGVYKAVHLHEIYLNAIIFPLAKKSGIKNLIVHAHATKFSDKKINAIRNKLLCMPIHYTSTHLLACSKLVGNTIFGEHKKFLVLNNAIDLENYIYKLSTRIEIRNRLEIKDREILLGHIGRFNEQKNHIFLINLLAKLKENNKYKYKLILVGEGPLKKSIISLASKLEVYDDIIMIGRTENIPAYLCAMDIFLLPSLYEGLPLVAVEAQAAGLPVLMSDTITTEIGIVHHSYLTIKNENAIDIWSEEILSINTTDLTDRLESASLVKAAGFDIKSQADKLKQVYMGLN